ncbi:MAG: hypothetical protein M1823_000690 [Watsoniomyces obsoletus]|nr:MAG: hypothetical protein M1823_000690 [Watsoniomyces obsoletus]
MTQRDHLNCVHEPFGDAFYFGPERLSERYEKNEQERLKSGFSQSTYQTVLDGIEKEAAEGKRLFVKDMTHYLVPPHGNPAVIAPSVLGIKRGIGTNEAGVNGGEGEGGMAATNGTMKEEEEEVGQNGTKTGHTNGESHQDGPSSTITEPGNPTVLPRSILEKFHFTFLIRHPRSSVPSYYRCTIPPLNKITGFDEFMPSEMGYDELRRVFDYLKDEGLIGPNIARLENGTNQHQEMAGNETNGVVSSDHHATNGVVVENGQKNGFVEEKKKEKEKIDICVIDADDLLDNPPVIIEAYCRSVGLPYDKGMLNWSDPEKQEHARATFAKWKGFHEDALDSDGLRGRNEKPAHLQKKPKTDTELDAEWRLKFGDEAAKIIRETVDRNVQDYEYLKGFALKI